MADPRRAHGATASKRAARVQRTPGQVALRVLTWVGIAAVALAVVGGAIFGIVYASTPVPDPNKDFQTNVSTVFYRDGKETLGSFAVQNRVSIPLDQMPDSVKEAVVDGENESFWTDPGISVPGLLRAVRTALTPGVDTVGGSTITQQYVKVLYLTQEKTLTRKLTEIVIALKVGQDVSKEKILEGYLNTVYFGRGSYGIQTAAKAYFGVDAKDLTLPQSIALTAIINSPNNLDPARGDRQRADLLERYQYIINQMVKLGHMTEAEKAEIYTTLPDFPRLTTDSRFGGPNGFLLQKVKDELKAAGFDEAQIDGGGLRIVTTIDKRLQDAAVKASENMATGIAARFKKDPLYYHPALASVDTTNGAILAMYSGRDFTTDYRSWAEIARPTGSTFKPWALVAGLRDGATLTDRFDGDNKLRIGPDRVVNNAGGRSYGSVTLETATTESINTAYVDLVRQMKDGPAKVRKAAQDAGVTTPIPDSALQPTIPLGYSEVTPLDAARGLATLVNGGKRSNNHIVAEVQDVQGRSMLRAQVAQDQTIEPPVAQNAVAALTGVVKDGTAQRVSSLGYPVAGKTGTYYDSDTEETKATWFVGATRQISTAVVLTAGDQGYSDLGADVYGSTFAVPGWLEYMRVAVQGLEKIPFPGPTRQGASGKFSAPPTPTQTPKPAPTTAAPTTAAPTTSAPAPSATPTPTPPPPATTPPGNPKPPGSPEPSTGPTTPNNGRGVGRILPSPTPTG